MQRCRAPDPYAKPDPLTEAERRAWKRHSVKVIRGRRVALRKAFSLADKREPLWEEAQRAVEEPPH
jgi:hypothetical protein